jgi:uncharacterized protein YneF (UPF0154 family)
MAWFIVGIAIGLIVGFLGGWYVFKKAKID